MLQLLGDETAKLLVEFLYLLINNKNVSNYFAYVPSRYRQTPNNLKRAMRTPSGVNHLLTLGCSFDFGDFGKEQDSADASTYMLMLCIEIAFAQQTSSELGLYSLNRNFL